MRKHRIISAIVLVGVLACAAAIPSLPGKVNITLRWDHPPGYEAGNSNWLYRIYQSDNGTNWTAITNVSGLSNSVVLVVEKAEAFYYATTVEGTNFWNESVPSNVAQTPAPPLSGVNLSVSRGPK